MSNDLKKLYSDIIKRHQETPFHFEKKADVPYTIKVYNPICGDRFEVYIEYDQKTIKKGGHRTLRKRFFLVYLNMGHDGAGSNRVS